MNLTRTRTPALGRAILLLFGIVVTVSLVGCGGKGGGGGVAVDVASAETTPAADTPSPSAAPDTTAPAHPPAPTGPPTTARGTSRPASPTTGAPAPGPSGNSAPTQTAPPPAAAPKLAPGQRVEPTSAQVKAAIAALHQRIPLFQPTESQLRTFADAVCTSLDQGQSRSQVEATVRDAVSRIQGASLSAADAAFAVTTVVQLRCPGYQ